MSALSNAIEALYDFGSTPDGDNGDEQLDSDTKVKGEARTANNEDRIPHRAPSSSSFSLSTLSEIGLALHAAACHAGSDKEKNAIRIQISAEAFRTHVLASLAVHTRLHAKRNKAPGLDADRCTRALKRALKQLKRARENGGEGTTDTMEELRRESQDGGGEDAGSGSRTAGTEEGHERQHEGQHEGGDELPHVGMEMTTEKRDSGARHKHNGDFKILKRPSGVRDPPLARRMRVVFDPSRPLGMVFADTIVKKVRAGGQADLMGVQRGWRIAEVCGKPVIRGFKGSDRSVYYHITKDKTMQIGVVFECRDEGASRTPASKESARIAALGAGEITLVFEANDVGLSIVTAGGVVDKVSIGSEAYALGVSPGWVIKSINDELIPHHHYGSNRDDFIQQTLCKIVSSEEPVKITFLLPHRLRPDILSQIVATPRRRNSISSVLSGGGHSKTITHSRSSLRNGGGTSTLPSSSSSSSSNAAGGGAAAAAMIGSTIIPTPSSLNGSRTETSLSASLFSRSEIARGAGLPPPSGSAPPPSDRLRSPRDFVQRARDAIAGFRKRRSSANSGGVLGTPRSATAAAEELKATSSSWEAVMSDWSKSPKDGLHKARKLARRAGIPPHLRAKTWSALIGNPVRVTPRLYDVLLDRVKIENEEPHVAVPSKESQFGVAPSSDVADEKDSKNITADPHTTQTTGNGPSSASAPPPHLQKVKSTDSSASATDCARSDPGIPGLIKTDINRTFAHLSFFQRGCLLHDQLLELLCVYAKYRPDVGYIQGMSFVAGHLLLYIEDVYMAFVVLANLLNMPLFSALFQPKGCRHAYTDHYELHQKLLEAQLPQISEHFRNEGVAGDMYLLEWLITLFCRRLRLDTAGRLWDMYFTHGEIFVHKAAIAIVKILQRPLLASSFAGILKTLKEAPVSIDPETLVAAAEGIRIRSNDLNEIRKTMLKEGSRGHFVNEW